MKFNAIVFEVTSRCNARCKMCYQAAGPKGSKYTGDSDLNIDDIKSVLSQAIKLDFMPKRVHFGGGEGFIDEELMFSCIEYSKSVGYEEITAVSNCFWGTTNERADAISKKLFSLGLTQMEISWDVWHAPFIKSNKIENAIKALHKAGVKTNLRLLTTKSVKASESVMLFNKDIFNYVDEISVSNVIPTGQAMDEFDSSDIYDGSSLDLGCRTNLNFTINPLGNVAPCCSGADQTESLVFGNVRKNTIKEIHENMEKSLLLNHLVFNGSSQFLEILEKKGVFLGNKTDMKGPCHACWKIFSDKNNYDILSQVMEPLGTNKIVEMAKSYFSGQANV